MEAFALHRNEGGMARANLQVAAVSLRGDVHLKKVHGIVPVYEDGSAFLAVPPRKNLYFQALDENYMELQRMRSFINLMPGERRSCIGCHEMRRNVPGAVAAHPMAFGKGPSTPMPQPGDRFGQLPQRLLRLRQRAAGVAVDVRFTSKQDG